MNPGLMKRSQTEQHPTKTVLTDRSLMEQHPAKTVLTDRNPSEQSPAKTVLMEPDLILYWEALQKRCGK